MALGRLRPARTSSCALAPTFAGTTARRLAPRSVVAAIVLALCAALWLASAAPASAINSKAAGNKTLAALGSTKGSDAVIVFGLTKPLRAGTKVTLASAKKPAPLVVKVGSERAFFFYEDLAPSRPYPHPGLVALVGVKSGKVTLSKTIMWRPLVNGKLPAFLRTSKLYRSSKYRVYYRLKSGPAETTRQANGPLFKENPSFNPGLGNSPPKADTQDVTAKQDSPRNITLTGSDGDGDLITFAITKQPDHGTLSGQPPNVTYTPNAGYLGRDDFSFRTDDGQAISNTAKVSINVVPLGSPPTVTTSAGCTAYSEHTAAVPIDGQVAVSDPDDTTLASATVQISPASFQGGDDLLFTDQNGISGSYDDSTGVLTLTGTASVADYQAALRSVRYRNLATRSTAATKDVQFTVNDAGSDSTLATKQLCITTGGTNDPPIGQASEGSLAYTENDGPVPIDPNFVVGDPDSTMLSGATVQLIHRAAQPAGTDELGNPGVTNPDSTFFPGEDHLSFTSLENGITGSYNDATGTLTLTGMASVADYETALRSVTYENSSDNPSNTPRTAQFQVTDASGATSSPTTLDIFVTPVNDAPVVTTTDGSTSYTEGDNVGQAVDASLSVYDVDSTNITGAQVRISSGFQPGDDLVFVDQLGISGSYDTGTGVLTLTGTASVADYQTALQSIKYRGTSDNPSASKTVEFTVNDGELDSIAATKDIAVTGVNDKPVLATTNTALSYSENAGAVAVDPGITANDVDSANLQGATVQITGNFSLGEDRLAFTDQNGITGFYDSETGTLTLTGSASVADYQTALSSVTYENTSNNPATATRTVTFRADDGASSDNLSDPVTRDINVTASNDAPVVTTSDGSTTYTDGDNVGQQVDASVTVSDVDDTNIESAQVRISSGFQTGDDLVFVDQLGISGSYDTGTGVLTLTGTASVADYQTALQSIKYRNTGGSASTSRTVEFTVNDGDSDSAAAVKTVDIVPNNQ